MPVGVQIALSAEELLAKARQMTKIGIVDESAIEPLDVLLTSLNEDAGLHASGAEAMVSRTLRLLCNRLRMQRDFKRYPEIADQKIVAPIFNCGMGRTGSTKAHRLLSYSGDFNWLAYWQVLNPSLLSGELSESAQARIDDAVAYTNWFDSQSPDLKYAHAFEPLEPEEESLVLEHSLRTPVAMGWAPVESYLDWVVRQDLTPQFTYLRDTLKYLQWQGLAAPSKRWVLKSPLYTGLEQALLSVFPDACLVMTHRRPVETMASGLRLMELFHKPFTDYRTSPEYYVAGQSVAVAAHLQNRATMPDIKFLDIHFKELIGSVESVIEKTYDFIGLELTAASRKRMLDWDASNPQHKKGQFSYALEDYGLTNSGIDAAFADYNDFMKRKLGK